VIQQRGVRPATYLLIFGSLAFAVFLAHAPYLGLPYFWDELGQFVPSALDIYHDGAFVPHSAVPNAHPPGVMAYLALVWKIFGYSIVATRAAMLVLAGLTAFFTFLLAIRLRGGLIGAPVLAAILLLLVDPLFYMQSMMAQLDMPAMLFTVLALLLFLEDRHIAAALASTALVLSKETGALLPLILAGALLFDRPRAKYAVYYLAPFAALSVWFFVLWRTTGQLFGDAGFTHYNLGYALNPVRAALCLIRRIYYLGIDNFRWAGSLAILLAWKRTRIFSSREWKITWAFLAAHVVLVSVLGGAELERYLLPTLPLLHIAMAAAFFTLRPVWRNAGLSTVSAGLLIGLFVNPPYPFPFENNLAMADFVELHRDAAGYLDASYPNRTIYTAWPLTAALRDPAFGYVTKKLATFETSDLGYTTLRRLDPKGVDVLVLYSRTWEPPWSVLHWPIVKQFLRRFYLYEPQMEAAQVREHFGLVQIKRWTQRGQWIEIYSRRWVTEPRP
jgi:4-amino-4-deoxy-L-arabinose transferase-like glycosyltransferase